MVALVVVVVLLLLVGGEPLYSLGSCRTNVAMPTSPTNLQFLDHHIWSRPLQPQRENEHFCDLSYATPISKSLPSKGHLQQFFDHQSTNPAVTKAPRRMQGNIGRDLLLILLVLL